MLTALVNCPTSSFLFKSLSETFSVKFPVDSLSKYSTDSFNGLIIDLEIILVVTRAIIILKLKIIVINLFEKALALSF